MGASILSAAREIFLHGVEDQLTGVVGFASHPPRRNAEEQERCILLESPVLHSVSRHKVRATHPTYLTLRRGGEAIRRTERRLQGPVET